MLMAPESVFQKASKALPCHPGGKVMVSDAYRINADHYEALAYCIFCRQEVYVHISRKEYYRMSNSSPWYDSVK